MMSLFFRVLIGVLLTLSLATAEDYRQVEWEDLMPEGWEPSIPEVDHEFGVEAQAFETPKIEAPVVPGLNDKKLKIPGYVIPISFDGQKITEFLLVPFMGACIHVPPPPENQMVFVTLKEPLEAGDLWDPVWVSGVMSTQAMFTKYATAGYHMKEAKTEVYEY